MSVSVMASDDSHRLHLTGFRVKNFKGFKDSGWISLRSLTLFMGDNSSGKTAILQPLRMLVIAENKLSLMDNFECLEGLKDVTGSFDDVVMNGGDRFDIELLFLAEDRTTVEYHIEVSKSDKSIYGKVNSASIYVNDKLLALNDGYKSVNLFFISSNDNDLSKMKIVGEVNSALRSFSDKCQWISGSRYAPDRNMLLTGVRPDSVGEHGQDTYNILYSLSEVSHKQLTVVNGWLKAFGYKAFWKMSGTNRGVFCLKDLRSGQVTNLVDNGYGISQSMPIAVEVETMSINETLIIDSPEAFLQTRMQGEMGALLVEGSKRGTVIAETGSEALLYRVLYMISNGTLSEDDLALYFIDQSSSDNSSECNRIVIDEYGDVKSKNEAFNSFFSTPFNDMMKMEKEKIKRKKGIVNGTGH